MNYFYASHVPIIWRFAITFTLLLSLVGHIWYHGNNAEYSVLIILLGAYLTQDTPGKLSYDGLP